ncbi:GNAT family N-acetyltransferase [Virgibacillus sp. YIM 98842]|uniref:GNAT family N-acetyltransferase n=1 Tax=Virgibacillus sp. YIM 98842 TaxID=2663533 RepID=UPI0013DB7912|nr:GNAT family N-acetyltransferase [Virgibacillus sp. YIM 98842]
MANIKQLNEKDYDRIFELSQYAFQYELSTSELEKKKAEAKRHKIWGWMEDGELAAKLHIIPLACYIDGEPFKMGGISSVATWPEYRRKGMVKELLQHALHDMKENGQQLSFLHPFSFPFYRQYGWEHAFTQQHYSIPVSKLKKDWGANGYVRRVSENPSLLHQLYTSYAASYNGMLTRDEAWWKQRVLKDNAHIAVAYNPRHEAEGYIIFTVKNNEFLVQEIVYNTLNGRKLLLQFIGNHDSMAENAEMIVPEDDQLALLVDEPRFEQQLKPYFMARIVDAASFLAAYPFQGNGSLAFQVEDTFFPENNGGYQLRVENGKTKVTHVRGVSGHQIVYCSIQILAGMLLGYRRPVDYFRLGKLQTDKDTILQLEKMVPEKKTFFADFF